MYEYSMQVISVTDGDTIHAQVDLGFDQYCNKILRLYGINAPEKKGATYEAGKAAMLHLVELLTYPDHTTFRPCLIWTYKDKQEKYGRYLAEIFVEGDKGQFELTSVNNAMIRDGHAVEYMV